MKDSTHPALRVVWTVLLLALPAGRENAGVIFYHDANSFAAAVVAQTLRGTEDWTEAGNAVAVNLSDPLSPGVPNGPFLNGSSLAAGVQVQSNGLGANATTASPGHGLYYSPAGFVGISGNVQPSDQVSADWMGEGFDMIFLSAGPVFPVAVSFSPMYYELGSQGSGTVSATLTIQVYNQANWFLGSTTVSNVQDCLEGAYLGIMTTGGDFLGRVNVWSTADDTSGADNIAVYAGPVPPPLLQALSRTAGNFNLRLEGLAGQSYVIQSSSNFVNWDDLQTNLLTGGSMAISLPAADDRRAYRARWSP